MGDTPYFLFLHSYSAHAPYGGYARYREEHPERGFLSDDEIAALARRFPPVFVDWRTAKRIVQPELRERCTLFWHNPYCVDPHLGAV